LTRPARAEMKSIASAVWMLRRLSAWRTDSTGVGPLRSLVWWHPLCLPHAARRGAGCWVVSAFIALVSTYLALVISLTRPTSQ
jgi:hypothetical protein